MHIDFDRIKMKISNWNIKSNKEKKLTRLVLVREFKNVTARFIKSKFLLFLFVFFLEIAILRKPRFFKDLNGQMPDYRSSSSSCYAVDSSNLFISNVFSQLESLGNSFVYGADRNLFESQMYSSSASSLSNSTFNFDNSNLIRSD